MSSGRGIADGRPKGRRLSGVVVERLVEDYVHDMAHEKSNRMCNALLQAHE